MNSRTWYVLHSKPHKESQLHRHLVERGIESFYPTLSVTPVNPRASRIQPYFPSYLFVRVDLNQTGISSLQWMPGSNGLVQFDNQPAPVAEQVIARLQEILSRRMSQAVERHPLVQDFGKGEAVVITEGAFKGYEAIFDEKLSGTERVYVLLEMLGRSIRLNVNARSLKKRTR